MTDKEIFYSDYKDFQMNNHNIGITQVKMTDATFDEITNKMNLILPTIYKEINVEMLFVLVTNIESK